MNILTRFKMWAKEQPALAGLISVLVIGSPFIAGIIISSFLIENHTIHAITSGIIFSVYMIVYILINKFILK